MATRANEGRGSPAARFEQVRRSLQPAYVETLDALTRKLIALDIANRTITPGKSWLASLQAALPGFSPAECAVLRDYAVNNAAVGAAAGGDGNEQLLAATRTMQETQMAFNRQYLQLQEQMANENRSYTEVANIMETKRDTVKDSVSNIR